MVIRIIIFISLLLPLSSYSQSFNVEKLQYSGEGDMYAPSYYNNKLVVCSNKKDRIHKTIIDASDKEPIDLYIISQTNGDSISNFESTIRTLYNDGPISFNEEGTEFIVSKNIKASLKDKKAKNVENHLGLYRYSIDSTGVKLISELPFNNERYNCSHPSLSSDGNVLYFSSNMPGGFGGIDIWKSIKSNGVWGKPENVGGSVNSGTDEVFPSIVGDKLYYSTDKGVFGGLDIYCFSLSTNDKPSKILPDPLNSEFDDFAPISKNNFNSGFLSSNREGKDGIYKFNFNYPEFDNCDSLKETYFCYEFYQEYKLDLTNVDPLIYRWRINNEIIDGDEIEYCFPGVGQYEVYLDVIDTVFNQTFLEQSYFFIDIEYEIQPYITSKDTVVKNEIFSLSSKDTYLPFVEIENYYWIIDGVGYTTGTETTISFSEEGSHVVELGVIDSSGYKYCAYKNIYCGEIIESSSEINNLQMIDLDSSLIEEYTEYLDKTDDSTNLVFRIEAYLSKKELDPESSAYKSLSQNDDFMIKYLKEEDSYLYLIGKYENVEDAHSAWSSLILKNDTLNLIVRLFEEEEFKLNEKFILNNIQFETDRYSFTDSAYFELEILLNFLKSQPNLKLQINAFTDSIGEDAYNLKLSLNRAKAVSKYLVEKGIDEKRLTVEGRGELDPIGDNSKERGRAMNRRVEFIIRE